MPLKLKPGDAFPSISLPDHTGQETSISELAGGQPLILTFYRGAW